MNFIRTVPFVPQMTRLSSTANVEFVNRNPRNLERMRIARKPDGYHLEKPGRKYWHKLVLTPGNRSIIAKVIHFLNGPVVEVKTSEWALQKQLYSPTDTCAYISLGKVLAQRCIEFGITEMYCDLEPQQGGKAEKFLEEVVKGGITLQEPEVYKKPNPWDQFRPEKPWEVHDE
ncbi:large ribosomal subunit protein uL18m [Bombyx mori]|uniref:Large ribosomal subunit protein uL18m n=1 Tax=Bombyx mori TaxID=7091 RepID=A0A8R1WLK0_BOMMO|nr:39S ribosomal protein L18, mitochondrial [Bombyx mori]